MDRHEAEAKILEKAKEIRNIVKDYGGNDFWFSIVMASEDDYVKFFNDYWNREKKLQYFEFSKEDE